MTTIETNTEKKAGHSYRAYQAEIEDMNDIECLARHLPSFLETADRNGRKMTIEIWYDQK